MVVTLGHGLTRRFHPVAMALGLFLSVMIHWAALHVIAAPQQAGPAADTSPGLTYISFARWPPECVCLPPEALLWAPPLSPGALLHSPSVSIENLEDVSPPANAPPPLRTLPRIDQTRSRLSNMPFPLVRIPEHGGAIVRLRLLVDRNGKVADVKLDKSSGHRDLDRSAIEGSRHGLVFIPGTEDGSPAAMWMQYQVRFQ